MSYYLNPAQKFRRQTSYDATYQLDDGATAVTTSAISEVGGSAVSLDFGTDVDSYPTVAFVGQITSVDFADADETYQIDIEMSDTTGYTVIQDEINIKVLGSTADNFTVLFPFKIGWRFLRMRYTTGGTTPIVVRTNCYLSPGGLQ